MLQAIKNKKSIFFMLILMVLSLFVITGCKKEDTLEVLEFKSLKTSYYVGENIDFEINLNNPRNYEILNVEINNTSYVPLVSNNNYSLLSISDKNLIKTLDVNEYKLNSLTYAYTNEEGILENRKLETNKKCNVLTTIQKGNDLNVDFFEIDKEEYYKNDNYEIKMNIKISDEIYDSNFIIQPQVINYDLIKFNKDSSGNTKEEVAKTDYKLVSTIVLSPELSLNNKELSLKFTANFTTGGTNFLEEGSYEIRLKSITYTTSENKGKSFEAKFDGIKQEFKIIPSEVNVNSFVFNKINNEVLSKYTNILGELYAGYGDTINLNLQLIYDAGLSDLNKELKSITLNNTKISTFKTHSKTGSLETISFDIKLTKSDSSTGIFECQINELEFSDGNKIIYTNGSSITDASKNKITLYDDVLETESDINNMNTNNGVVTGKYILKNNITISKSVTSLFNNKKFDGFLEGNGYNIINNKANEDESMFSEITADSYIRNIGITSAMNSTNLICSTNNGTLENVNVNYSNILMASSNKSDSAIIGVNNGTINNMRITASYNGSYKGEINILTSENKGIIKNVIFGNLTFGINDLDKIDVYFVAGNNQKAISNVIIEFKNFKSQESLLKDNFNFHINTKDFSTTDKTETAPYVREELLNTDSYKLFKYDSKNCYSIVTDSQLGYGEINDKSSFCLATNFIYDGQNNFWNISENGAITFKFR